MFEFILSYVGEVLKQPQNLVLLVGIIIAIVIVMTLKTIGKLLKLGIIVVILVVYGGVIFAQVQPVINTVKKEAEKHFKGELKNITLEQFQKLLDSIQK